MQWFQRVLGKVSLGFALVVLTSAQPSVACSDYGCGYDGLYLTGGYSMGDWGTTLMGLSSYSYDYSYSSSYGGSCGSLLSTCGGGYDYAGLYGNNWGLGGGYSSGDLLSSWCAQAGGYGGFGYTDIGCSIGMCSGGSYLPAYGGFDYGYGYGYGFPNDFTYGYGSPWDFSGGSWNWPGSSGGSSWVGNWLGGGSWGGGWSGGITLPTYPSIPVGPINGGGTVYPTLPAPVTPSPIPWGGCDGTVIPCPTGPVTRNPVPSPSPVPSIPITPPTPTSQTNTTPPSPIRYNIPRGTH